MILGIDEVGRGAWAGPLVVGAVVLGDTAIDGLTDSKLLTKKRREALAPQIREQAAGYGLGWVSSEEIDQIGLSAALKLATVRAVSEVKASYHEIIIDGTVNFLQDTNKGHYVTLLKKADLLIPSVSAASIIAKVARDDFMAQQEAEFPGYGFADHVGYGTAAHRLALANLGRTPLHRMSFSPIKTFAAAAPLTTKHIGDSAETKVAEYLTREGHTILERNWKTRFCEIDIISSHDKTLYFTEVKFRRNSNYGDGFAAITDKKLQKMKFAAELYALKHEVKGIDLRLASAGISAEGDSLSWLALD